MRYMYVDNELTEILVMNDLGNGNLECIRTLRYMLFVDITNYYIVLALEYQSKIYAQIYAHQIFSHYALCC